MNRTHLSRKIAGAFTVAAVALVATSGAASAHSYDYDRFHVRGNNVVLDGGIEFASTHRAVSVGGYVTDAPGDSYCTVLKTILYSQNMTQLGYTQTIGSVCNGTAWVPAKRITTSAGDIARVVIFSTKGTGGPSNGGDFCYADYDFHSGTPDSCR